SARPEGSSMDHSEADALRRRPAGCRIRDRSGKAVYQEKTSCGLQPLNVQALALVRDLGQPLRAESGFQCNAEQFPPGVRWAIHVGPPQEGGYPQKLRIRVRCRSLWA